MAPRPRTSAPGTPGYARKRSTNSGGLPKVLHVQATSSSGGRPGSNTGMERPGSTTVLAGTTPQAIADAVQAEWECAPGSAAAISAYRASLVAAAANGDTDTLYLLAAAAAGPLSQPPPPTRSQQTPFSNAADTAAAATLRDRVLADLTWAFCAGRVAPELLTWMFTTSAPTPSTPCSSSSSSSASTASASPPSPAPPAQAPAPGSSAAMPAPGAFAAWRDTEVPYLAAAAYGAAAGLHTERTKQLLESLYALHFRIDPSGRTFLAAVRQMSYGRDDGLLVDWLLCKGCSTGPDGWAYACAIGCPPSACEGAVAAHMRAVELLTARCLPMEEVSLGDVWRLEPIPFTRYLGWMLAHGCPYDQDDLWESAGQVRGLDAGATAALTAWATATAIAPTSSTSATATGRSSPARNGGAADPQSQQLPATAAAAAAAVVAAASSTAVAAANRPRSMLKAFAEVRQEWLVKLRVAPTRSRRAAAMLRRAFSVGGAGAGSPRRSTGGGNGSSGGAGGASSGSCSPGGATPLAKTRSGLFGGSGGGGGSSSSSGGCCAVDDTVVVGAIEALLSGIPPECMNAAGWMERCERAGGQLPHLPPALAEALAAAADEAGSAALLAAGTAAAAALPGIGTSC
ncbi:hypothetical protein HYH02_009317 [Chlamydomonas schloesseri]|uniref:Uncharacterized protein n=1 Tax=Chlamydomonas schloesseri TaxID=2026947 RepID=A0A835TD58_9CHLO|nr:hypothetical protein HYH02_009317 [Chlamydomonas schloesseri]|eukprot:KAG2443244.1 hypothetical protein HYH02_009317 [Chlamydomonas schloesseri]